ncbi:metaxin-2-like [Ischnura elegans]|uniref:metaxin-2-like n=1 Tax=Ischnura elegans TaxID=197161 RepID=UPI001ED87E06|nr:metaxin-2-like [Ischnura elegans]
MADDEENAAEDEQPPEEEPEEPQGEQPAEIEDEQEEDEIDLNSWDCTNIAENGKQPICFHYDERWQDDIHLYEPYEVEQALPTDYANCLAVQAYLKMCKLNFTVEMRGNAEFMSPSGQVPFIKCGSFVVSELDPIVAFFAHKDVSLSNSLSDKEKGDMRAYMSLVNNVLTNAEQYVLWNIPEVLNSVTKTRYGSVYPWPLDFFMCLRKRWQCMSRLRVYGWWCKSQADVYEDVEKCCNSLASRLGEGPYFFGGKPTELDALVFGHVYTLLSTPLPDNRLASIVHNFPQLTKLSDRIEKEYFANSLSNSPSNAPEPVPDEEAEVVEDEE